MKTKIILILATIVLLFTSCEDVEVGKFYITKQYPNAFELEQKPFRDTIQVLEVKENSIKYVNWIGWGMVEHETQFFTNFESCQNCETKTNLVVKVTYEDRNY